MTNASTMIIDIDVATDVRKAITFNTDIRVTDPKVHKTIFHDARPDDLIRIEKTINSPITIIKADIITDDFLDKNLKWSEE